MRLNMTAAESAAIHRIEELLTEAGWSDGWALTDEEVKETNEFPLFYRNSTPTVAPEAKITKDGQTHSLYCIYNIVDTDPKYAGNKPLTHSVSIALTFYYDDPFLFYQDDTTAGAENPFAPYLEALLENLADDLWAISSGGEGPVPAAESGSAYSNRKILFVQKIY